MPPAPPPEIIPILTPSPLAPIFATILWKLVGILTTVSDLARSRCISGPGSCTVRGLGGLGFKRTAELFWTWYIKCVCTSNAQYPNILTDLCNNILLNSSKIQIVANEVLEHLFIGIPIPCCCCMASASLDCGYDEFNLRCITRWVAITSQCLLSISFMHFIDVTKALYRGPSACCAELNWKWHHKHSFSIIINVVEAIEGVMPSVT